MAFNSISREPRRAALVTELRFAIVRTPNGLAGRIKLPPTLVKELSWESKTRLDVMVGDGDDAGWVALKPVEANHRARLRIQPNGVGVYTSSVLVPKGQTDKMRTITPEARINENTLYMKIS